MTAPRHLWSGDWRRESAAAAADRARREAAPEAPSAPPPPSRSKPPLRSVAARALVRVRSLRPRGAVLLALAMLLGAGVGYAAVSSLVGTGGGGSSGTRNPPIASSPARATAPAWLGVHTIDFPPAAGVMVVDVVPGSPADAAGLQPGDVITQIGNRPVQAPTDLESALAGMHSGQRIVIQYQRGPTSYTTQATLRARPANGP